MNRLKKLYSQDSIIQFLVSYILVLVLPLIILSYGFSSAFQIVKNDIENSYITMLSHSVSIIDNELDKMENLALQTSQKQGIQEFSKLKSRDKGYIMVAFRALDNFYDLMNYQSIELLGEPCIYFRGMDLVMYDSTYYQPRVFEKYLKLWGIPEEEWKKVTTLDPERRLPGYQKIGKSLAYVMPSSERLTGNNEKVLIFFLNQNVLKGLLDFSNEYDGDEYTVRVYDKNDSLLWSNEGLPHAAEVNLSDFKEDGYYEEDEFGIIYSVSPESGWKYVLAIPEKQALSRLSVLKNLVFLLSGVAMFAGICISLILSVKKGKPINEVIQVIASSGKKPYEYKKLGEAVTGILRDHQELLEELEKDKPLMRMAFFHDLLKAEFKNEDQLKLAAKKAEIEMDGTAYLTASFELFAGNDFYEVDEQTLDEVHIILQLMEKYLLEAYPESVWFYKKNYRITTAVFALQESEEIVKNLIVNARQWLLLEYNMETNWGIGNVCEDLMLLWKASEESIVALNHCSTQSPIVEYSSDLDNILEYYFPDIAQEMLVDCILSGHMEKAEEILGILEKENCINRNLSRSQFMKLNRKVLDMIPQILKQDTSGKELLIWLNETVINQESSHEEYFKRLKQICQRACHQNVEQKNRQRGQMIEEIMEYMKEHYMDSGMGLAQIGTVFRVSEGYLSSIFKEQAGVNFTDYLEGIRIEKACILLKDGRNTVNEIAERVGYNSVQSFRRAFKRVKGMSPREARDQS
jgi:AraC-like DNA-binding protein